MNKFDPEKHHRRSIRLKGWDYSQPGAYYVTLCTQNHVCSFGQIHNEDVILSKIGHIAYRYWMEIPNHFGFAKNDVHLVMPNHLHGILFLSEPCGRGVQLNAPTESDHFSKISPTKNTLSVIIRTYKGAVTKWCRRNGYNNFQWQRNYYDRIIRNDEELNRIREYIIYNPEKWENDRENPKNRNSTPKKN